MIYIFRKQQELEFAKRLEEEERLLQEEAKRKAEDEARRAAEEQTRYLRLFEICQMLSGWGKIALCHKSVRFLQTIDVFSMSCQISEPYFVS